MNFTMTHPHTKSWKNGVNWPLGHRSYRQYIYIYIYIHQNLHFIKIASKLRLSQHEVALKLKSW